MNIAIIILIVVAYFALTVRVVPRRRQDRRALYLEGRRRADRRADLEDLVREACGG